jgi:hypothetical protein
LQLYGRHAGVASREWIVFNRLELALSEEQIPQIVENIERPA